jgi:hypothetical protein
MNISSKLRLAIGLLGAAIAYASPARAAEIVAGQDTATATWATLGGTTNKTFNYSLFNTNLGTLNSVSFMINVTGKGQWMADYGGDGTYTGPVTVTLTGGQAYNMDGIGNNGWVDPNNGWNPVINDVGVSNSVAVNTTAPFWIMSPNDGPQFQWGTGQMFNLPNMGAFTGSGSNQANFNTYSLMSVATNPNLSGVAAAGHDFEWSADYKLIYNYTPVPEPSGALLGSLAFAVLGARRRRSAK